MKRRHLPLKQPFCLDKILDGTQDFRWCKREDGWHSGVLCGNLIHVRQDGDHLEYRTDADADLNDMLTSYFRLDEDLQAIHDDISCRDDNIAKLVKKYPYLRILRQPDPWECTVAYICSARSDIQKTAKSVKAIAKLGDPLELDGDERHTFPSHKQVREAGIERLEQLELGLPRHAKNVFAAAKRIESGKLDLCGLKDVTYGEAKLRLMACDGIGPKVADCIALFALGKTKAFPVDTRIRKAVQCYFPKLKLKPSHDKAIVHWAQDLFGENVGYASQFFFQSQKNPR